MNDNEMFLMQYKNYCELKNDIDVCEKYIDMYTSRDQDADVSHWIERKDKLLKEYLEIREWMFNNVEKAYANGL